MKARQWLLRAGVVLILVGLVIPVSLVQANGVAVTLDAPTQVRGTTDFIARLNISHVVDFDACALRVRFDPAVLSLTGVTDGNIGGTTIPVAVVVEKEPELWGVVANVPSFPGVTGEGYLMEFHFHAADVGAATDTDITLEHYSLSNKDAQAIPATWVGDTVHVFLSDELAIDHQPASFSFTATIDGMNPAGQTLDIWNSNPPVGPLDWSVADDAAWLSLNPTSDTSTGEHDVVTLSVDISGMIQGSYSATIIITASGAANTPQTVPVTLTITSRSGGGAPGGISTLTVNLLGSVSSSPIWGNYRLWHTITITSPDGNLTINIPRNTRVLNKEGNPPPSLQVTIYENPPPPPENANIIGLACNFEPDGVTFDPLITLEYTYDPDALPEGVAEEDLVIAYYDEDAGEWVELDCVVDTVNNTITASVSHFTTFAIIGTEEEEVAPPPAPATFTISSLGVSPSELAPGEEVNISVLVSNTGGKSGSYSVVLKINGVKEAEERVTIAAGGSETVTFSVTKEDAASYGVTVDGLGGSFTVIAPAIVTNWPVLGGIIAALVIVALHIIFLVRSEKRRRLGRD